LAFTDNANNGSGGGGAALEDQPGRPGNYTRDIAIDITDFQDHKEAATHYPSSGPPRASHAFFCKAKVANIVFAANVGLCGSPSQEVV